MRERDYSYSRKKEIFISKTFRVGQSKANNTNKNASSKTLRMMMLAPSVCNNACINTILFSP